MRSKVALPTLAGLLVAVAAGLPACGGGGGGGGKINSSGESLNDPIVYLIGDAGRFSMTPDEANAANGASSPSVMVDTVEDGVSENQWFRMSFPFRLEPRSLLSTDPLLGPFSQLNGNLTVTDVDGNHLPGIVCINGIDAFGNNRSAEPGYPVDSSDMGSNLNVSPFVLVYIADVDEDLATGAPFGYWQSAANPNNLIEPQDVLSGEAPDGRIQASVGPEGAALPIDTIRITLSEVNGVQIQGCWTISLAPDGGVDQRPPFVKSIVAETPDPTDPGNLSGADIASDFLVEFSEPVIPQSVGRSAELNGSPYAGNIPELGLTGGTVLPAPPTAITATVQPGGAALFIPFDCVPLNTNNLATYRIRPLIAMPPHAALSILERAITNNVNTQTGASKSAMDLAGNPFDGQSMGDTNGDGVPEGDSIDVTRAFTTGPGPAIVNIPVLPEVMYWMPGSGRGIGAVDLNGKGFTTNTPGANAGIREQASIVTKAGTLNLLNGIALLGSPCDTLICVHNNFQYNIGLGGWPYGLGITEGWSDPSDPGNPGTPFPGVNEVSSGYETLCRDSTGEVVLTGRDFGEVGAVSDIIVGEFLDRIYYDSGNAKVDASFHLSIYGAGASTLGRNVISDPPAPNPPPTRYWVGLPQLDVVIDQADPLNPAFLIEGEEVFTGSRAGQTGWQWLQPNPIRFDAPDVAVIPNFPVGPGVQSASAAFTFSSRQQIGNFLYATDTSNGLLHAINSNTMRVVSSFDLPDPTWLALGPSGATLYVSNPGADIVSVIGADPSSADFHQEIARIPVIGGPGAIAVQPDNEDIHVACYSSNKISIIDQQSLTVRKEITALIDGPFDLCLTPRQLQPGSATPFGWGTGIYFGYISNHLGNSLLVYESGPSGPQGIGHDNILGAIPSEGDNTDIIRPRGLCASPLAAPGGYLSGGCFLAHQDTLGFGVVSHVQFTEQAIFGPLQTVAPPGFFVPPGFLDRKFARTAAWGTNENNRLIGNIPADVSLADFDAKTYHETFGAPNFGFPPFAPPAPEKTGFINSRSPIRVAGGVIPTWLPNRLYVSYLDSDRIQALDPQSAGVVANTLERSGSAGGIKALRTFFDQ